MRRKEQFRSLKVKDGHGSEVEVRVGEYGTVRLADYSPVRPSRSRMGYVLVNVGGRPLRVHRLVAEAWLPNPEPSKLTEVDHVDSVRWHNSRRNLRWTDHRSNVSRLHARRAMRIGHAGQARPYARKASTLLLEDNGRFARFASARDAAKWLGVSLSLVYRVAAGGTGKATAGGFHARWTQPTATLHNDRS